MNVRFSQDSLELNRDICYDGALCEGRGCDQSRLSRAPRVRGQVASVFISAIPSPIRQPKGRKLIQSSNTMYEKQLAFKNIEMLLDGHKMCRFRNAAPEEFAKHAADLVQLCKAIQPHDVGEVAAELRRTANEIARIELTDPYADGHHERAADAIRDLIPELEYDNCPWKDLLHLLSHIHRTLGDVLWRENKNQATQWKVDLDLVTETVWGDVLTGEGTIRPAVSKFATFLKRRGVTMKLQVKASSSTPHIACKTIDINEEKIAAALDNFEMESRARKAKLEATKSQHL